MLSAMLSGVLSYNAAPLARPVVKAPSAVQMMAKSESLPFMEQPALLC